jgi:hypothetical protein
MMAAVECPTEGSVRITMLPRYSQAAKDAKRSLSRLGATPTFFARFGQRRPNPDKALFLRPLFGWLAKPHTRPATLLVDELDAGGPDCTDYPIGGLATTAEGPIQSL